MITTCTYHCGHCHRHFHSLEAFDMHRQGDYASSDPEPGRRCLSPFDLDDGQLVVLSDAGECRMYDDGSKTRIARAVTIWASGRTEHPRARERRLARLAQPQEQP